MGLPMPIPKPAEVGKKKNPDEPGKLYPRGMVNYLLNLLIGKEKLKGLTLQSIPSIIMEVIHSKCKEMNQ